MNVRNSIRPNKFSRPCSGKPDTKPPGSENGILVPYLQALIISTSYRVREIITTPILSILETIPREYRVTSPTSSLNYQPNGSTNETRPNLSFLLLVKKQHTVSGFRICRIWVLTIV